VKVVVASIVICNGVIVAGIVERDAVVVVADVVVLYS